MTPMRGIRPSRRARRGWRLAGDVAMAAVLLALLGLSAARMHGEPSRLAGAMTVHDGDTISGGEQRIRLWGIDAPELSQTCQFGGGDYACGRRARDALLALVADRPATCEWRERDRYGRLLAICHAGDMDLNGQLAEAGWAVAFGGYDGEEKRAREARRGLWAGEFERPRAWRDRHGGMVEIEHLGPGLLTSMLQWLRFF